MQNGAPSIGRPHQEAFPCTRLPAASYWQWQGIAGVPRACPRWVARAFDHRLALCDCSRLHPTGGRSSATPLGRGLCLRPIPTIHAHAPCPPLPLPPRPPRYCPTRFNAALLKGPSPRTGPALISHYIASLNTSPARLLVPLLSLTYTSTLPSSPLPPPLTNHTHHIHHGGLNNHLQHGHCTSLPTVACLPMTNPSDSLAARKVPQAPPERQDHRRVRVDRWLQRRPLKKQGEFYYIPSDNSLTTSAHPHGSPLYRGPRLLRVCIGFTLTTAHTTMHAPLPRQWRRAS